MGVEPLILAMTQDKALLINHRLHFCIAVSTNRTLFAHKNHHHKLKDELVWFTSCGVRAEDLQVDDTFPICQAGYPNRRLVYDEILR